MVPQIPSDVLGVIFDILAAVDLIHIIVLRVYLICVTLQSVRA